MITVDPWLLDLGEEGPRYRQVAAQIARIQHDVSKHQGHVLALNDNYVRGRIKGKAKYGQIAHVNVRCIRCGAVTTLMRWGVISRLTPEQRERLCRGFPPGIRAQECMVTDNCKGDVKGTMALDVLNAMAEGKLQ